MKVPAPDSPSIKSAKYFLQKEDFSVFAWGSSWRGKIHPAPAERGGTRNTQRKEQYKLGQQVRPMGSYKEIEIVITFYFTFIFFLFI